MKCIKLVTLVSDPSNILVDYFEYGVFRKRELTYTQDTQLP